MPHDARLTPSTVTPAWCLAAVLSLAACGASTDQLKARARFDLGCSDVDLTEIDGRTWGVTGCGQRATYVESCGWRDGYGGKHDCTWVLNNTSEPVRPTKAGAPAGAFPRGDAAGALGRATQNAQSCLTDDGPSGESHLKITFAASGEVSDVVLEPPYAGTSVGECIEKAFRRANVPSFVGAPVTVGKTFTLMR